MSQTIKVLPVEAESDFLPLFNVLANAFGTQLNDAIWTALSPGWETDEGREAHAARLVKRWKTVSHNKDGDPNTVFLKAVDTETKRIVGFATWDQFSFVPGWGDEPSTVMPGLDELYPSGEGEKEFTRQIFASLFLDRVKVVRAKMNDPIPAIFALEVCAVDPGAQKRGIGQKLVQWGLDEAKRRGGLESTTEASVMGRGAYAKLGFKGVREIEYEIGEGVLKGRRCPSNLFMRTGP